MRGLKLGLVLVMASGCGPTVEVLPTGETEGEADDAPGDDDGPVGTSTTTTTTTPTASEPGTTAPPVTSADPTLSTSATTDPTITIGPDDTGGFTTGGDDLGQPCMSNDQCSSGMCFLAGILGGVCSECLTEDDCVWGCNLPNPIADPPLWAMCGDGMLGAGCNSNAACMGALECAVVIDVPGVLSATTCGECLDDGDCPGQLCSPVIEIEDLGGYWACVDAGSIADGEFCDHNGSGDAACANYCGVADIMGLVEFGVCGECTNNNFPNEGCLAGETCQDPDVQLDGTVTPSSCV